MLYMTKIRIENAESGVVTDSKKPRFSFSLSSDKNSVRLVSYRITVLSAEETVWDSGERTDGKQISILYCGKALKPFADYKVIITATDNFGESAEGEAEFTTGRLDTPWQAKWITDTDDTAPEKSSPTPLLFKKTVTLRKSPVKASICATALGIYELRLNGERLGDRYFAPGFTSYLNQIQYDTYSAALFKGENTITAGVGAGWAVGAFTYTRTNKTYADVPSLLLELRVEYADGTIETIGTDETWLVSCEGRMRFADWYDGEVYDATVDESKIAFRPAEITAPRGNPKILAAYGSPVRVRERFEPVNVTRAPSGELVYDFGQNFAGVIYAEIDGRRGQTITFRHAEVLEGGELFTKPLRTAKAQAVYICADGEQIYSPTMTYMGFRYVGVSGIDEDKLKLSALALSSDVAETGYFRCSDERLNQLQHNIRWGGLSNFVDIPTDCPQRDERMGWTGDIAVFAQTAAFNFDMSRFLEKWLVDLQSEQDESGALPMTCPKAEDNWKKRATGCWGDSCVLVPWAEYLARGDEELLRRAYPMMKKFLALAEKRASMLSIGRHKRIWSLPFQFGDWCAPDEDFMQWIMKGKWVATAYFANSCRIVSEIAGILGESADAEYYKRLYDEISGTYMTLLCNKNGRLKKEFQTAYVLPLYFGMAKDKKRDYMAKRLAEMVESAGFHPRTGFPGTPYLLFALSDNGEEHTAFRTLTDEGCPGWLYAVRAGATTIWERWDALRPDGTVNTGEKGGDGGMVSFNHYANGAVGDFLYRRIAGIDPTSGGYKTFRVSPIVGGGIISAEAGTVTPYGKVSAAWRIDGGEFALTISVPVSTSCTVKMPSGKTMIYESGSYTLREPYPGGNGNG